MKRRDFLKQGSLAAGVAMMPSVLKAAGTSSVNLHNRNLVFVHLKGGNDGLNTVIPHADPMYRAMRPTIAVSKEEMIKVDDKWGFHPALAPLVPLYEAGQMLVMQQVGFDHTEQSHYHAAQIWQTGCLQGLADNSWIPATQSVRDFSEMEYDQGLDKIFGEINTGMAGHIYHVALDGFDTHQFQRVQHDLLLGAFSAGISSFMIRLKHSGHINNTLVIAWTEFGRSVKENIRKGTDHGASGQLYVFGSQLKRAGIEDCSVAGMLERETAKTDFREVYATIGDWLGTRHHLTPENGFRRQSWA
ncbi:DUF1501 domain-containing protein [Chitinophaga sp. Cy-1792]|uniref:DUF1501 domain-containing protein n=1 Tax=Chitinophaga sp. Cy-1792 TaxID=2608339 RepID=UPI0014245292|nr:DUF1501 domain-containing protein [Chitinophaga sp. Cy-1792]NIG51910.1 DUF1501 domain-containing protein [Chitinophaga sp. Cy-1792]